MTTLSTTDVSDGTTIDASDLNNNLTAIKTVVNGGIDNGNISPGAAISYSKLSLGVSIVNADIATGAAIAASKLAGYPSDATKVLYGDGSWAASAPAGAITMFGGAAAPTGYLLCDGAAVNRTTYAALFAVVSTLYGVGNGSTTFNLPDFQGRVAVGFAVSGGHVDVSTLGGVESGAVALANRRPKHNHTFTQPTISSPGITQPTISSPSITQPTISAPAVNITDTGHTHTTNATYETGPAGNSAYGYGSQYSTASVNSNTTGITAALASAPVATGAALASAPVATGAALASAPIASGAALSTAPVASSGAAGVGGTAATDTPAYQVVNYIIKT